MDFASIQLKDPRIGSSIENLLAIDVEYHWVPIIAGGYYQESRLPLAAEGGYAEDIRAVEIHQGDLTDEEFLNVKENIDEILALAQDDVQAGILAYRF